MPYPQRHVLLAWGGLLRAQEEWSMTLRVTDPFPVGDRPAHENLLEGFSTLLRARWAAWIPGAGADLLWIKANEIRPDGKYAQEYTLLEDVVPAVQPGRGASTHPNQIALAMTLETGVTRGLAARGRMFFPIPIGAVDGTGLLPAGLAQTYADETAQFIQQVNGLPGGPRVSIFSDVREGAVRPVTAVSCGRVLDVMRSRRAQLDEDRRTTAVVAPPP